MLRACAGKKSRPVHCLYPLVWWFLISAGFPTLPSPGLSATASDICDITSEEDRNKEAMSRDLFFPSQVQIQNRVFHRGMLVFDHHVL